MHKYKRVDEDISIELLKNMINWLKYLKTFKNLHQKDYGKILKEVNLNIIIFEHNAFAFVMFSKLIQKYLYIVLIL